MNDREAHARAVKALSLLDVLAAHVAPAELKGDAVRLLTADAWTAAERAAAVRPSSATTRELVAHLADSRRALRAADIDPFAGLS